MQVCNRKPFSLNPLAAKSNSWDNSIGDLNKPNRVILKQLTGSPNSFLAR